MHLRLFCLFMLTTFAPLKSSAKEIIYKHPLHGFKLNYDQNEIRLSSPKMHLSLKRSPCNAPLIKRFGAEWEHKLTSFTAQAKKTPKQKNFPELHTLKAEIYRLKWEEKYLCK